MIAGTEEQQGPFNYKRIKRLSRMSGLQEEAVHNLIVQEYQGLKQQRDEKDLDIGQRALNEAQFDTELLKQLYGRVLTRLGIENDYQMEAAMHGFDLKSAETYLLDVGYSKPYVENLKRSPVLTLISYPKFLNKKHKKKFEYMFEKELLKNTGQTKHPLIFYAEAVGKFITDFDKRDKDPFSELVKEAKTLPLSALKSLYRYKYDVVLRHIRQFYGFKWKDVNAVKETFSLSEHVITDFCSYGTIEMLTEDVDHALRHLNIAAKLKQGKRVVCRTTKGVTLAIQLKGKTLQVRYQIRIDPRFRVYGIRDPRLWIKKFVVKPYLTPPLALRGRISNVS